MDNSPWSQKASSDLLSEIALPGRFFTSSSAESYADSMSLSKFATASLKTPREYASYIYKFAIFLYK